jgi:hypothetical protein
LNFSELEGILWTVLQVWLQVWYPLGSDMFKASHCVAIALAFLVAASLRASAGERASVDSAHTRARALVAPVQPHAFHAPWRLVFK